MSDFVFIRALKSKVSYYKDEHGRWHSHIEGSVLDCPMFEDFGKYNDPKGTAPIGRWLSIEEIRNANKIRGI